MTWEQTEILLKENVKVGLHLTPHTNYKFVREVPPFICKNYNNTEGFRVQVGKSSYINLPLSMLKELYQTASQNNNIYNSSVFKNAYPKEIGYKPCYVHSVGKLFEHAGVMKLINKREYIIVQ